MQVSPRASKARSQSGIRLPKGGSRSRALTARWCFRPAPGTTAKRRGPQGAGHGGGAARLYKGRGAATGREAPLLEESLPG